MAGEGKNKHVLIVAVFHGTSPGQDKVLSSPAELPLLLFLIRRTTPNLSLLASPNPSLPSLLGNNTTEYACCGSDVTGSACDRQEESNLSDWE